MFFLRTSGKKIYAHFEEVVPKTDNFFVINKIRLVELDHLNEKPTSLVNYFELHNLLFP